MKTYFLRFANEDEAIEQLVAYRSLTEEGDLVWIQASVSHALDVVGTIYKPSGVMLPDGDGGEYPEMLPLEGYHINLAIASLPEALQPFSVTPSAPARVFA